MEMEMVMKSTAKFAEMEFFAECKTSTRLNTKNEEHAMIVNYANSIKTKNSYNFSGASSRHSFHL